MWPSAFIQRLTVSRKMYFLGLVFSPFSACSYHRISLILTFRHPACKMQDVNFSKKREIKFQFCNLTFPSLEQQLLTGGCTVSNTPIKKLANFFLLPPSPVIRFKHSIGGGRLFQMIAEGEKIKSGLHSLWPTKPAKPTNYLGSPPMAQNTSLFWLLRMINMDMQRLSSTRLSRSWHELYSSCSLWDLMYMYK